MMKEDNSYIAEAATDYWSPCCPEQGIYAHFLSETGKLEDEVLCGFQCAGCNKDYDVSCKDDFET